MKENRGFDTTEASVGPEQQGNQPSVPGNSEAELNSSIQPFDSIGRRTDQKRIGSIVSNLLKFIKRIIFPF